MRGGEHGRGSVTSEKEETVECYPLHQLLEENGRLRLVDFMSVDSEGMVSRFLVKLNRV